MLLLAAAVAAAVLAGCGKEPLTRAEYLRQADSLCRKARADLARVSEATGAGRREEEIRRATQISADFFNDFKALEPPDELADAVDRYIDRIEENRRRVAELVRKGDQEGARRELADFNRDARTLGRRIGYRDCVEVG